MTHSDRLGTLENVVVEVEDGIALVTVNRPKALNALNEATHREIGRVFEWIRDADEVRAVVLTGAGEKAFVAGADVTELAEMSPVEGKAASELGQRVFSTVERCGKVVVAAINGFALGGGLELALACHVRFAAEGALLGLPEVKLGLMPGYAGTQRLARLCGVGRALELTVSADMLDAATAERYGIVNRVLPADELLGAARKFAGKVASRGPLAVRFAMEAVLGGVGQPLSEGMERERDLFALCFATEDMREGTRAFLEKRKAAFRGV